MAEAQLETDEDVGLAPAPRSAAPSPALESDSDVGLQQQPAPTQDPDLEQALLQRARTVSPLGMAATGLEALRRVAEAKLGVATPERGRTVPEIQRQLLREPDQSFVGQLTEPVVHYQPYKVEREDHPLTAIGKEIVNVGLSIPEFFTSPLGVLTPGIAQAAPATTAAAFTADMLYNLGKGIVSTVKGWTGMSKAQKAASIVDLGANGLMALALGHQAKRAGEEWLFKPAEGRTVPPEVQAWAATFGVGTGEAETAMRAPGARVIPTQPYVPPAPGPMQPIPPLTTTEERTTDVTPTGVRIEPVSQETQLPGVREGQNLPAYTPEVRQETGGQAAGGGGPQPSPEIQAANPPDELLDRQRYQQLSEEMRYQTAAMRDALRANLPAAVNDAQQRLTAINQELEDIKSRYGGFPPSAAPPAVAPVPPVETAPTAPTESARPPKGERVEFTSENIERGRAMISQMVQIATQRQLTDPQRRAIGLEIENIRQGYYQGAGELLDEIRNAPVKPPKVGRAFTAIDRFHRESEQLQAQIGEEDILAWIHDNQKMLSRNGALKRWGRERFNLNKSLWDDAPTDMPIHHEMAIYGGGSGPDVVAQAAFEAGKIADPSTNALWDAIDRASKTRRGATPEAEREARVQAEDERQFLEWQDRTKQAEPGKEVPVTAQALDVGDLLEVDGQQVKVTEVDPDNGDVTLEDGQKFGVQKVREGEGTFYVQKHEKEATGEIDFAPEEPAQLAKPALPTVPGPLPKGIAPENREEAFRQQRERWDKYNADVAAWEAAQPQNKPIIFRRENGSHAAITPDPQGGWRVTTFTKLYADLDKLAPWGHERYNTRLEAVQGMLSGGRDGEMVDRMPEVMTEEEIRQENERRNAPAPAAREIEPMRLSGETKKFKKTDWGSLRVVSEPTGNQPQIRVDEDGTRWAWKRSNPSNVWADRVLPEREIITPANDRQIGVNAAGEQLYERADGSVYRMRFDRGDRPNGYPDFGGDLAPFPHEPPPAPPTLRPGETTGELFQGADQPFNLAGEAGSDADRLAAERAAAEQRAKEAADLAARQQPELPTEPPKPAGAAAGTRVGKYVKGEDGWYLVDEEGNRRNVPRANKKISARLEEQAAAPPAPPETRSPIEVLAQATKVRIKLPEGGTVVRVTDTQGRKSDVFIADANRGENVFRGVDIAKIEAGFINKNKTFQKIKGAVTVEDVGRKPSQSLEAAFPPQRPAKPVMTPEQVSAHVQQMFPGAQMIRVVNDPNARASGEAHFNDDFTKLLGIDINAAAMRDAGHIRWVVEHEIAHAADKLGNIRPLLDGITNAEFMAILNDVQRRGYKLDAFGDEVAARSLQMLASDWKGRSWFEKLLGSILKIANDLGYKMTRLAAEKIAAKSMADATKLVGEKSALNGYSVTRTLQSLPLKPEDWHMKEFFNEIGLQAATIGGYLHRYTRQVFHADELGVSDRARALDKMNEARELTELAQGMGGRVNYHDAVANASTLGERNEVLRSAFESVARYQQIGVDLRRKTAEKLAVLQSEKFRNKLTQAAQRRDKADLTEEVRRTYTLQIAASAGRITQTLNDLRTVGGAHEQLQADLARVQQLPGFDQAVAQHFDTIVNSLSQTDRGISLLIGGGDRVGQEIWDEYLRNRFAAGQGIPQGNEFALGQLASAVLAANRDLRNQFASLALLARDIVTTQEWNRAGSIIAQSIQNDPQAAIPRILQRAGNLGERAGRAEAAWLALNRSIERTLRDYSQHEEAVRLHDAVETDGEYRQWVNDVLTHPDLQGLMIPSEVRARMETAGRREPFFKYTGQDTLYSPQGKPYQINLQFTPDNVQATMADLIKLGADITDWLEQPENQNNPDRRYWQEWQRMVQGTLMSSAIWNPGAMESAVTKSAFGMPENFYQGLALPSAKLAFLAQKAFDRYWAQGKGWYGNNVDLSERAIQLGYKGHGFNELNRKSYQKSILNALAWEFRNGRVVRVGDIINGHKINADDITLLFVEGRMTNELYERMLTAAKASGAGGVMEMPRVIDEFTSGAWGVRKPLEIGVHKNTTLPHNFSQHGEALARQVNALISARNAELDKLPQRVIDQAMSPDQQNFERADIQRRFYESLAQTLNDPDIFQNAVLGFMRQRAQNWVKLDGLSPFEEHYREITRLVSEDNAGAPKTIEEVLNYLNQHVPAEMTPDQVRRQFFGEWEKLAGRFYKMHSERDTAVKVTSDKRTTAFTQGFQQDLGPAYFYDYGWIDAGDMRRYSTDMGEFGFERMMEAMRALRQNMMDGVAELSAAAEERKPEIIRRTMAEYHEGRDFRNLQTLQNKILELDRLIENMPRWSGVNAVHAEGISLKGMSRFVSFMIGAALTGPRTAARISGVSMGGSAWKMGIVFSQLGYGRLRSFPAAAASAITSAFRVGTATGIGWYQPGRGLVPGVPIRLLLNIPSAIKAGLAKEGSERIYSAIETVLKGTTDEQFAALGWWHDQKALGMTPDTAIGARIANILSASRTKGGVLSIPETIRPGAVGAVVRGLKLAVSKPWALGEAFVAGTNVYLPGAFGYNITYDAVGRQAGWYIDMLAANARRTFDTYERLGQLGRFNFDKLTDPRNKLQPWEVLPSFVGRFRFVDPARLPAWARPNSTNLQLARELFSTSTDIDLQDLLINYWKRLSQTPREQRGAVEFLAPEELDAAKATEKAEGRARGIISRFVEQTHHAAPSNRPYQLQKATAIQAILPFMGWSAQTLKLIDTTLGKVAFSAEARGVQADTYAGLMIAAGLTALGVGAYAFAGGDLEARMIRELDRLLHNKEGTVKTIDEARDMKEAAEITLHNMTAGIPMLNSMLNSILGFGGYRGGSAGFQAFAFDKVNSMLTYARDVYRTHDLTHGLDRLAEANIPISETIIENTFSREGLQNNRNAVRVLQKFGPQDLVERRASLSIALPTEMTPYRQALVEAIGSGDQTLVAKTYQAFIEKATELGRTDPDKLARQMFSTLNPYRQAFGGVLTDQQRSDTLAKMSPVQRKMVETMEQNYGLAAATLGLTSEFEKAEKTPPIQRGGVAAGGGGGISLPSGRAAAAGGGLSRIGTGLRRISLSGPRAPRIRLPGVSGVSRAGTRLKSSAARPTRFVHGRLSSRSPRARRLTARRTSRRRISLSA